jgi:hypothetical protein
LELEALVRPSDKAAGNEGDTGDIVTPMALTAVPDAGPPWKLFFERVTLFMAWDWATGTCRFCDTVASHAAVVYVVETLTRIGIRRQRMFEILPCLEMFHMMAVSGARGPESG